MEIYEIVKSIGSGNFGQAYLCRHKREEKYYVMKKIKTRDMNLKEKENTEQEVRLLQKLRHSHIVSYKDSFIDKEQYLNIVMIYCEGGDMYDKIKSMKGKNFTESQIIDWFVQMALALFYLHDKRILHRDLKTQNIFLKHDRVRLGDFGIAKVLDSTKDFANTCIGTPYYMSPELYKYENYSYKSDVWALGCCLYEMCNLKHAFDAQSLSGLAVKILKGTYPPITQIYSKPLRDLISYINLPFLNFYFKIDKMLSLNPKQRPTIVEILNKAFIRKRLTSYFSEIFSGNYPEANLPNDVDDVYIDSLKEQAEKLGIVISIKEVHLNHHASSEPNVSLESDNNILKKRNNSKNHNKENLGKIDKSDGKILALEKQTKKQRFELRKAVSEKKKLEEEVQKLENKKKTKNNGNQKKCAPTKLKKKEEASSFAEETPHPSKEKKIKITAKTKSEVLKEKDKKQNDSKEEIIQKKTSESLDNIEFNQNQVGRRSSQEAIKDEKKEFLDQREKVLYERELKKKKELNAWEEQYKIIARQNLEARKLAIEKQNALYRPSNAMKEILVIDSDARIKESESSENIEQYKRFKIEEDYDMNEENKEEEEIIYEEENEEEEEDEQEIEKKIDIVKSRINEKTIKIQELKESLKKTLLTLHKTAKSGNLKSSLEQIPIENQLFEEEKSLSDGLLEVSDDLEDSEDIENQEEISPKLENSNRQNEKILDRIKVLKFRCEAGLGNNIFQKAYNYIRESRDKVRSEIMKKNLIEILGEEFIGYWHFIDQMMVFEDLYSDMREKK